MSQFAEGSLIAVEHLRKEYPGPHGDVVALDDVTLRVGPGEAVAVVGHNGAGKSTLLRVLTGITRADRGCVEVLGWPVPAMLHRATGDMGCLIDRPGFIGGISGHANIEIIARRHGLGGQKVHRLLDRCGITSEARHRVFSTYSLGMRQRLGIAVALLGDPALLILDEPTNGLDPGGIAWVRDLVREHTAAGGSVLLASHLLTEVEAVCHRVVVLVAGRVARQGTMADLVAEVPLPIRLQVTDQAPLAATSLRADGIAVDHVRGDVLHLRPTAAERARLTLVLAESGIGVITLEPAGSALEHVVAKWSGVGG